MKTKTHKTAKKTTKTQATKTTHLYAGAPIPATRLFRKDLPFGNCDAVCFLALNEIAGTATYINAYGKKGSGEVQPRSSFDPATYTYPIKLKVIDKKMNEMEEVEPDSFPSFITNAHAAKRRGRKPAAK